MLRVQKEENGGWVIFDAEIVTGFRRAREGADPGWERHGRTADVARRLVQLDAPEGPIVGNHYDFWT